MSNNKSPIFNWPENPNGEPLKLITTSVQEQIPTQKISNTFYAMSTIFASVTEFVDDTVEGIKNAQLEAEEGLSDRRQEIIDDLEEDD